MKSFFIKYKKVALFCSVLLLIIVLLTTAAVTNGDTRYITSADDIATVSKPTGEVVSTGIDVSRYQGNIDFDKVKADGYDFVIIRVGTTQGCKDDNFDTNYENATKAGLDVGCYYYTYSTTVEEAKLEAKEVLSYIKGKSFTYPVFYDFEYPELLSYSRTEENNNMIDAFCKVIRRGGYYPGVYISNSAYNNHIDSEQIGNTWDVWVANYRDTTSDYDGYSKSFSMWQYSNTGRVSGIESEVDLNVCYVDYPSIIDEFNKSYSTLTN
jgi:GH25 family lysozyme M1 (1,4-beta-N-acetylmuramidase)